MNYTLLPYRVPLQLVKTLKALGLSRLQYELEVNLYLYSKFNLLTPPLMLFYKSCSSPELKDSLTNLSIL
jgi:hypothetical protein